MWYLIEDLFEQPLIMKAFLGVGWLAIVVMIASFAQGMYIMYITASGGG